MYSLLHHRLLVSFRRACFKVCVLTLGIVAYWPLTETCHVYGQSRDAASLMAVADRCEALLQSSVVDFYLPGCIDQEHGGYLEELASDGSFRSAGTKFLTLQSRQLWTFSVLAEHGIVPEQSLQAAKHGFEFIRANFRDKVHGGYFNEVADNGEPTDRRKHVYLNSFVIYGFVAYYRASKNQDALAAAKELFDVLDEKAYDAVRGGYEEYFAEDWTPLTDPSVARLVGEVNTKTYNTHLHLLESFADLYRATEDPLVGARLAELIQINSRTVQHPQFLCNIDGWSLDWNIVDTQQNLRASYGHDVECVWLVLDAARALGYSPKILRSWAQALVDYSLKFGFDETHGGFYYGGPLGKPADDRHKEWWVEAEALVSMLEMYRLTQDDKYMRAFEKTFEFVSTHQIAEEGGWWASRNEDGSPSQNLSRTSKWQAGYHNGRALLLCSKLLRDIAHSK